MQTDSRSIDGRHLVTITLVALLSTLLLAVWARPAAATTFTATVHKETSDTPQALAVGDVNDDGRDDVVVGNFNSNSISVFLQETSGTLTDAINYQLFPATNAPITRPGMPWWTTHPTGVAIGDVDGDGQNEVVVTDEWNWAVFYFDQTNPGSMTDPLADVPSMWQNQDLIIPEPPLQQPVAPGDDPTKVFATQDLTNPYAMAYRLHFENLDLNQAGDRIQITRSDGVSLWTATTPTSTSNYWTPPLYTYPWDTEGKITITFSMSKDATETTSAWKIDKYSVPYDYRETHPWSLPYGVAIGDVFWHLPGNEIVVANPLTDSFRTLKVDGSNEITQGVRSEQRMDDPGLDVGPYQLAIGDLNNDHADDLALAVWKWWEPGVAAIYRQGSTNFLVREKFDEFGVGLHPWGIAIGDLNSDGRNDVVATAYDDDSIAFALQNTAGYLGLPDKEPSGTRPTGHQPMGVTVADVTADGKDDIVVANSASNTIGVFTQSGASETTIGPQAQYPSGQYPYAVDTGDLDGDGGTEIVSSDANDNQITVYDPVPTVTWSSPSSGAYVRGMIHPRVTAPAGTGISQVQFFLDSVPFPPVVGTPYEFDLDTKLFDDGTHVLQAVSDDGAGHTFATPNRSFKIDNHAPVITYLTGTPEPFYPIRRDGYKDNFYIKFKLNEPASVSVPISLNGVRVRTLTASGRAGWNTVVWDGRKNDGKRTVGTYYYRVSATDYAGNGASTSLRPVRIKYYLLVKVAPNRVVLVPH